MQDVCPYGHLSCYTFSILSWSPIVGHPESPTMGLYGGGVLLKVCRKIWGNLQWRDGRRQKTPDGVHGRERRNRVPSVSLLVPGAADERQRIPKAASRERTGQAVWWWKDLSSPLLILSQLSLKALCWKRFVLKRYYSMNFIIALLRYITEKKHSGIFLCWKLMALKFWFNIYKCNKTYCSILHFSE